MSASTYKQFFTAASGVSEGPYPYQCRLACGERGQDDSESDWLARATDCRSRLIDIPTGLGKTAAVVLAWLWNRVHHQNPNWPRRLVYCLPMRTLVEQTAQNVTTWLENLAKESPTDQDLQWLKNHSPVVLMGGEDPRDKDWDLYPEKPAILIGTQDMLLSRALNRGYGMSRYRWPMHFGLLNNDCLWVLDEVQLMGPSLASTTQLEGFRKSEELGSRSCHSWWMSATIRPDWMQTVDMPSDVINSNPVRLEEKEKSQGRVQALRAAGKSLSQAPVASGAKHEKDVARFVLDQCSTTGLNLIVINTVKRAREVHKELAKLLPDDSRRLLLLHSQFRPEDRQRVLAEVMREPVGKIVVSTQVIEAGVDLSAHKLFTELAPWSSLVQRFGRCNRWLIGGSPHFTDASIHWFDLADEKDHPPYSSDSLLAARRCLSQLTENSATAALEHLESIASPDEDRPRFRHAVRCKDLIELFDTTPDLAGADLDLDRFIRDADSSHVQVFWREWIGKDPNGNEEDGIEPEPGPGREELCSTGITDLKSLLGKNATAWRWNHLDCEWQPVKADAIYPGQTYLLHTSQGGYMEGTADTMPFGWTGDPKHKPVPLPPEEIAEAESPDANEEDKDSKRDHWQTLAQHTDDVCRALNQLLESIGDELPPLPPEFAVSLTDILRHAARWHDWGKAHAAFQAKLKPDALAQARQEEQLKDNPETNPAAKAPEEAWQKGRLPKSPTGSDARRRHFRHELASALGVLHPASGFPLQEPLARDLAAYLVAAHHGKVRLSIRSLPDEWIPPIDSDHPRERRFARGVWDGDPLPSVALDQEGNVQPQPVTLSLEPMELGLGEDEPFVDQPSWAERALNLRDTFGPFLLAWLEAIIRAADARASRTALAPGATSTLHSTSMELHEEQQRDVPLTLSESALAAELVEDGLAIQDKFRPEPLYKHTNPRNDTDEAAASVFSQIEAKRPQLERLCQLTNVVRLDLFGSATSGEFRQAASDLDFVVTFGEFPEGGLFDAFMELAEGLEALFGRKVDLITDRSIRNPYFRKAVDLSRIQIYERRNP